MARKVRNSNPYGRVSNFGSHAKAAPVNANQMLADAQRRLTQHPEQIVSMLSMIRDVEAATGKKYTHPNCNLHDPQQFASFVKGIERVLGVSTR